MMVGWAMGLEGWIWMAAWAAVLVVVVWLLVREPRHVTDDAAAILRARFARGEIDEDEYRRALRAITAGVPGSRPSDASTTDAQEAGRPSR